MDARRRGIQTTGWRLLSLAMALRSSLLEESSSGSREDSLAVPKPSGSS